MGETNFQPREIPQSGLKVEGVERRRRKKKKKKVGEKNGQLRKPPGPMFEVASVFLCETREASIIVNTVNSILLQYCIGLSLTYW